MKDSNDRGSERFDPSLSRLGAACRQMSKLDDSDMQPHWKAELGRDTAEIMHAGSLDTALIHSFAPRSVMTSVVSEALGKREFPPSRCVPMQWVELAGLGGAEQLLITVGAWEGGGDLTPT
jgi:hypothetical protein